MEFKVPEKKAEVNTEVNQDQINEKKKMAMANAKKKSPTKKEEK